MSLDKRDHPQLAFYRLDEPTGGAEYDLDVEVTRYVREIVQILIDDLPNDKRGRFATPEIAERLNVPVGRARRLIRLLGLGPALRAQ